MKLSQERIDRILEGVADGLSKESACSRACISKTAFYKWLKKGKTDSEAGRRSLQRQLYEEIPRAEAEFEAFHLRNITRASLDDWRASGWTLERKFPDRYARRVINQQDPEQDDELVVIG